VEDADRAAAAADFYARLFGWTTDRSESGGPPYLTIANRGRMNGGIREQDPQAEAGIPANWLVYFGVEDLDGALARATDLGGRVLVGRMDMGPDMAIAVVQDPQGAVLALYAGRFDD
jgi:uncharacterized protein